MKNAAWALTQTALDLWSRRPTHPFAGRRRCEGSLREEDRLVEPGRAMFIALHDLFDKMAAVHMNG